MRHYAGVKLEVIKTCRRCGYRSAWSIDWQRHASWCHTPQIVRVPQVRKGESYPRPRRGEIEYSSELGVAIMLLLSKGV